MKKIFWTEPAIDDLDDVHHFIAKDSVVYANAVILEIMNTVDRLQDFPDSGKLVPDFDQSSRELLVGNYRIIYDYSETAVHILSVVHTARLFPNL